MPASFRTGHAWPERVINGTVGAGSAVLSVALLAGAGPAGGLALGVVLMGCAMSEANYHRGVYRVKPADDA